MEFTNMVVNNYYYIESESNNYCFQLKKEPYRDKSKDYICEGHKGYIYGDCYNNLYYNEDKPWIDECEGIEEDNIRELTSKEIMWLKACIKKGEFISLDKVNEGENYAIY